MMSIASTSADADWDRVSEIVAAAVEIPAADRAAYVAAATAGDATLAAEVQSLLSRRCFVC